MSRFSLAVSALAGTLVTSLAVTVVASGLSENAAAQQTVKAASPISLPVSIPVLSGTALKASWTPPLSTRGRYIVDANGNRFKLKAANWEGAQGHWDPNEPTGQHANTPTNDVPIGLDRVPLSQLMADFHALGLNSIRLPYSNAMLHMTNVVPSTALLANPQLFGKTPLQVFDAVVEALTNDGFAVILNDHTTTSRWCCSNDGNERWNSGQSTDQWVADWVMVTNRYKDNKRVVGMDLRNEVRRDNTDDVNWTWGDDHDLYKAYQWAGLAIQAANPDVLLVMEGINWQGIPADGFFHERPNLKPVATLSHTLMRTDKLVYSAHFYGFTGPNHTGSTGGGTQGETHDWRYRELSTTDLAAAIWNEAQYVTTANQHYTAPVWVSEFGTGGIGQTNSQEIAWWDNFITILINKDTDFAMWPLVGWADNGIPRDSWALLSYQPDGTRIGIDDPRDFRYSGWQRLMNASSANGQIAKPVRWNMLNLDYQDYNSSALMRGQADWDSGARKASCPDSQRLAGIGRSDSRGLCTDSRMPAINANRVVVRDERYVNPDFAGGYSKLQCPGGYIAVGYSVRSNAMSGLLCAQSTVGLPGGGRTIWFDHGDNRPSGGGSTGSDWAPGYYKGQCADNEYIAGVAFTWRWNEGGVPDAFYCRPLP